MPAVKTGIANVAGAFCPHMGTISQAVMVIMPHMQVAEMLTVYTQVQMVISKRVSGSASYGILVLTGVPPFYSLPTSDTYYTEKSRITLKVLGNIEMAVTHHKQCSTIFNSNIHLKNLNT